MEAEVEKNKILADFTYAFVVFALDRHTIVTRDYLGQNPPGLETQVFAPGIISTDAPE